MTSTAFIIVDFFYHYANEEPQLFSSEVLFAPMDADGINNAVRLRGNTIEDARNSTIPGRYKGRIVSRIKNIIPIIEQTEERGILDD